MTAAMKPWPGVMIASSNEVLQPQDEQEQDQEPGRMHADADAADPEELQ